LKYGVRANGILLNALNWILSPKGKLAKKPALDEYLAECGYEKQNNSIIPKTEMIGFEKHSLQVA
jgi:hypothetical protein